MQRRLAAVLVCAAWMLAPCAGAAETLRPENPFPGVAQAYVVQTNGLVVWHKNQDKRLAPASLTKLMTALLASETLAPDTPVTVRRSAASETGTRLGLRAGETLRASDLLTATLVASANDACRALADHMAGDEVRFVQAMNQRAGQMGLRNTHFTNACGHDDPQHYASAHDLLRLAQAVVRVPQIAERVAQAQAQISTVAGTGPSASAVRRFTLTNTNALIGRYPGVLGVKTGTTPKAGKCLVALAQRGANQVLLVMLGGKDRWWDAVDILDIAFASASTQVGASAAP